MIEEKVALFGGIGRQEDIVRFLINKNWKIAISYRQGRGSEKIVKGLIEEFGTDKILGVSAEISEYEEAEKLINETFKKYGRISIQSSLRKAL